MPHHNSLQIDYFRLTFHTYFGLFEQSDNQT